MNAGNSADEAYAEVCNKAALAIARILADHPEIREFDALDLWESIDDPAAYGIDPQTTILQWSAALDVVRKAVGLGELPHFEISIIGAIADASTRTAARVVREGMFVGSDLGVSFHCDCGWVSRRRQTTDHLGPEISWHLMGKHL